MLIPMDRAPLHTWRTARLRADLSHYRADLADHEEDATKHPDNVVERDFFGRLIDLALEAIGELLDLILCRLALLAGPASDSDDDALDGYRRDDEPAPCPPVGIRLPVFACAP